MTYRIRCSCGGFKATLDQPKRVNRCVCYCADCQAFARFLKREDEILDQSGGTEIIQVSPANLAFTEGAENLACMRLTKRGLLRWYAACCNTAIGNTPPNFKLSMVGLVHSGFGQGPDARNEAFGPIRMHVFTKYSKGASKPKSTGLIAGISRVMSIIIRARLSGSYKRNPFFVSASGAPVVTPKILNAQEMKDVKQAI